MWKPFSARFDDIIEQMKSHREVLLDELKILQLQASKESRREAAEERRFAANERERQAVARADVELIKFDVEANRRLLEQQYKGMEDLRRSPVCRNYWHILTFGNIIDETLRTIQQWLNPPEFALEFEKSLDLREDGTGYWIFEEPKFKDWRMADWSSKASTQNPKTISNALWIAGM